jgi:prepilin-type N-terminal cleavage/methylation domain-containing protein
MRLSAIAGPGNQGRRSAFTLLEVLLASAIGVLLMAALYVAVDVQLRHARAGREVIEQSTLARALLSRIANDISLHVAPALTVRAAGTKSSSTAGAGATSTASSSTTPTSTSSNAASSTPNSASSTSTQSSTVPVPYNLGVQGQPNVLILSVTKFPREVNVPVNGLQTQALPIVSDQRRISYWLAGNAGSPLGLARQELKLVTSDDATAVPPDVPDEASHVIAEEVRSLTFQYFDGTSWQDTWDGTQSGADGVTPLGPPAAIAVTVGIADPGAGPEGQSNVKLFRHVVAIPTANGATQAATNTSTSP